MAFGVTFSPTSDDPIDPRREGQSRNPIQEAVKILSLRLPKFYNSGAPTLAPSLLMNSPGGMGQPAARGNVVAQAFAQMAGLPPQMQPPRRPSAQGGGGGSDNTTEGWLRRERELNQPMPAPFYDEAQASPFENTSYQPPIPVFRPGDDVTGGFHQPLQEPEPPPQQGSGWDRPGRNPNLREKYYTEGFGEY